MAASWRLARAAAADLDAILAASLDRWGEVGRSRYASLVYAAFEQIAAALTHAADDVLPTLRRLHVRRVLGAKAVKAPVHVVYYRRASAARIDIVRVLHEREEPTLHVVK